MDQQFSKRATARERSSRDEGNKWRLLYLARKHRPLPRFRQPMMDRSRGGIRPRRGYIWARGGRPGGGWRRKARMDCGPRLGAIQEQRGRTATRRSPPISRFPPPRVFLLAFFAVTATSPHPPTTATAAPATRSVPAGLSAITSASSSPSVCGRSLCSSAPRESWPFRCNMQGEGGEAGGSSNDGRCQGRARQQKS